MLTCSLKIMDSTNQTRFPAVARAHCDVFQAGLPWQGMAKLYKGSIFVNHGDTICLPKSGYARGTSPTGYDALRRNSWVELSCKLCPGDITNSVVIHHQLNSRGHATTRRRRHIHWRFTYVETMQRNQKITFYVMSAVGSHIIIIMVKWRPFREENFLVLDGH